MIILTNYMRRVATALILFLIFSTIAMSDDDAEWKEELEKDYRKVLKARWRKIERHRGLASEWHERGHLNELIDLYEETVAEGNVEADVYYGLGYAYLTSSQKSATIESSHSKDALNGAVKNFSHSITLNPGSLLAHWSLAKAYKLQEKYPNAIEQYRSCLELDDEYYKAHYEIGEIYRGQKKYDKALSEYKIAGKIEKKWTPTFYSMGLSYLEMDDDRKARIAFEYVLKREKKHSLAHFKLGQVYAKEGNVSDALKEYELGAKYNPPSATILCELGKVFADRNKDSYALIEFQKAIKVDPDYSPAHFQIAEIYYSQGNASKSFEHYQSAIRSDPSLEGYFLRQFDKIKPTAEIDEAKILLNKSLLIDPNNALTHFKYAELEYEASNIPGAIEHYEKTIAIDENFVSAYVPLGNRYYEIGERRKAAQVYRKAVELESDLKMMFFKRAQEAFLHGDYNGAAEKFDKHSLIFPQDALTQYWLGQCYDKLESFDRSLKFYLKAVELDPTYQKALIELARNYFRRKDTAKMMAVLDTLIDLNPEHLQAHYLAGYGYLDLGQSDEAIAEFTKVVELEPKSLDSHFQLGILYENSEEIEQAIKHYERAIELWQVSNLLYIIQQDPSLHSRTRFSQAYLRVGKIYLDRDEKDEVIRVYSAGLQIEPNNPQEQYDLAVVYEERDELEKAIAHFGLANKFQPDKYDWHFRYARLLDRYTRSLEELGDLKAERADYSDISDLRDPEVVAAMAISEYTKTIKLNYAYADAFYYRGLFCRKYKQIGDEFYSYSQIAEDFKQAIELNPKMMEAYYQLGLTYVDMDDRSKAEAIFKKALNIDATYEGMNLQIGLIAEWREEYDAAIKYYKAEIENNSECVKAYQQLGYLYNSYTVELNKAKKTLKKALELDPKHVQTWLNYGNALYNLGETGSAIEKFEIAVELEPKNMTANYNLALMYEKMGKRQLAIARWKKFLELGPPAQWRMDALQHLDKLKNK